MYCQNESPLFVPTACFQHHHQGLVEGEPNPVEARAIASKRTRQAQKPRANSINVLRRIESQLERVRPQYSKPTCHRTSQGMLSKIVPPRAEPDVDAEDEPPLLEVVALEDLPKSSKSVFCFDRRRSLFAFASLRLFC